MALKDIAVSQARIGQDSSAAFFDAQVATESCHHYDPSHGPLLSIANALIDLGLFEQSLVVSDRIVSNRAWALSWMANGFQQATDRTGARTALRGLLPRLANFASCSLDSCILLARLYPAKSTDLAKFLIAFFQKKLPPQMNDNHHIFDFVSSMFRNVIEEG